MIASHRLSANAFESSAAWCGMGRRNSRMMAWFSAFSGEARPRIAVSNCPSSKSAIAGNGWAVAPVDRTAALVGGPGQHGDGSDRDRPDRPRRRAAARYGRPVTVRRSGWPPSDSSEFCGLRRDHLVEHTGDLGDTVALGVRALQPSGAVAVRGVAQYVQDRATYLGGCRGAGAQVDSGAEVFSTRAATSGLSSVWPATTSGTPSDSARCTAP